MQLRWQKPFGKRPAKWLELPSTKEFLNALRAIRKSDRLIVTINGIGTWMHEDVALEFARWLSPEFAIWCNDRIKELIKYGFIATPDKLEELISSPDLVIALATKLKEERVKNEELSENLINANKRINYQQNEIKSRKEAMKEQHQQILNLETKNMVLDRRNLKLENEALANAGKVNYYDRCQKEANKTLRGIRETANLLGIKQEILINTLLYNGYLYRDRYGKLRAYAEYLNKFFMLKECKENEYGFTPTQTYTTINGRKFIIENWSRLYKKYQNYVNSIK